MSLERPIVFGNWKMNGLREDGLALARAVATAPGKGTLGIFPPATILREVILAVEGSNVIVGAQNAHSEDFGAFTGSISAPMIKDVGGTAVLLGHSECRHGLGEADADVWGKAEASARADLLTVICIGETDDERTAGRRDAVLRRQIDGSMPRGSDVSKLVVAYEPVWAIGTGKTPSESDIVSAHAFVRERLDAIFGRESRIPILYGGSVKAENAAAILALEGVDGVLVGGASLDAESFVRIFQAGQ
ncbi:triosephosphate isomerase [Arboricoccus pini]|uniref:Triosephosphate isomerase n=1 Tax=Arboricoccus pini TaxID=1963835 RepID=A0A212QP01_9PROT|nr:triose-phosphate isomerase [Arboricoccus pini]SNB61150.1 triosephosphate isomerase [Arboricoccus pini]